jgi:hypothetical protein
VTVEEGDDDNLASRSDGIDQEDKSTEQRAILESYKNQKEAVGQRSRPRQGMFVERAPVEKGPHRLMAYEWQWLDE